MVCLSYNPVSSNAFSLCAKTFGTMASHGALACARLGAEPADARALGRFGARVGATLGFGFALLVLSDHVITIAFDWWDLDGCHHRLQSVLPALLPEVPMERCNGLSLMFLQILKSQCAAGDSIHQKLQQKPLLFIFLRPEMLNAHSCPAEPGGEVSCHLKELSTQDK